MSRCQSFVFKLFLPVALAALAVPASAAAIQFGEWTQFSFTDPGIPAAGCDPEDPAGLFCVSSSGTPNVPGGAPPWTFTAASGGAMLTITDQFASGDRFQVFDFGALLGETSAFVRDLDCGNDPQVCVATPGMSTGSFFLAAGNHSLTITPSESLGLGSGSFRVDAVPEPETAVMLGFGLAAVSAFNRRNGRRTHK